MATASHYLYVVAGLLLVGGFAAHVAHAALLAAGRGLVAAPASRPTPAFGGVVGGSFAAGVSASSAHEAGQRTVAGPFAIGLAWAAGASLGLALLLRGIVVARGPWGNLFEFTVAFALGIVVGYLALERRYAVRSIGFVPLGAALGLLLYSWTLPQGIVELSPALHNPPLLTIHVGMAVVSYGIFAMSFAAGLAYLVQERRLADGETVDRFAWLPSRETLDAVAFRAVIVGFPVFATMIVLGSWWASIAWSRWWGWDPKETSSLVTWLIYAVYLHLRNQRGWRGRPAALVLVVGFGMVLVTYSGNLWFPGLHSYSGL
ncbi:MAG TPA: cytochrome c biogenesis protein CcsA [Patescibacteria group bacterium]|nr:cytochrome c biogenesis protein CcsA [Patescibacteria group bacterium]